eukprot:m.185864 g.185864  ORF g.185864 m.185864 type:complete len:115 (+) comp15041_c0_seq3:639-983(+)
MMCPALLVAGIAPTHLRPKCRARLLEAIRSSPELLECVRSTSVPLIVPIGPWRYRAVKFGDWFGEGGRFKPFGDECLCLDGECACRDKLDVAKLSRANLDALMAAVATIPEALE